MFTPYLIPTSYSLTLVTPRSSLTSANYAYTTIHLEVWLDSPKALGEFHLVRQFIMPFHV